MKELSIFEPRIEKHYAYKKMYTLNSRTVAKYVSPEVSTVFEVLIITE